MVRVQCIIAFPSLFCGCDVACDHAPYRHMFDDLALTILVCCAIQRTGTAPHIDVKSTLAALSAKGKALLKGRFKEKIELMHLQLSTASASAGVGASSASGAVASHLSVPSTATGSNGPLSSKSAGSASGTGAAGAKKFGYPSAPANVFDFAADHNIAKSHSHDAGVEKGGIVLTGRNSSDSVGAVEKENRA